MMLRLRWFARLFLTRPGLVVVTLMLATCGGGTSFQVTDVSLTLPAYVPAGDAEGKAVISVSFNRAVDPLSLVAPGPVTIDITAGDARAETVRGTFQLSSDGATAVFISNQTLVELVAHQPGQTVTYTITLSGTESGASVVKDASGEPLDGDGDGGSGGDLRRTLSNAR
jgi:hypothetical protein